MSRLYEWSGNENSDKLLFDKTYAISSELNDFCKAHKFVYIFGAGRIGTGFRNCLEQCGFSIQGFITSDTLNDFANVYKSNEAGVVMGLSEKNLSEVLPRIISVVCKSDLFVADSDYREGIARATLEYIRDNVSIALSIAGHCNMNCTGCLAFAPLSSPNYYEYNEIVKDLTQIAKMAIYVKEIHFSGGEPYLHPNLFEIFRATRKLFSNTPIKCLTNGLLLSRLTGKQIEQLVEFEIIHSITVYPKFQKAVQEFIKKADRAGLKYILNTYEDTKLFTLYKLDPDEKAPKYNFINCNLRFGCCSLSVYNGKIYSCGRSRKVAYLNKYFGTDFKTRKDDYIDLYNTTPDELYMFKLTRAPFCNYCNPEYREIVPWSVSERKIEEWVHLD